MLAGYIDESYTGEKEPVTFGLNCVYATYSGWFWIQTAWNKMLSNKNEEIEDAFEHYLKARPLAKSIFNSIGSSG